MRIAIISMFEEGFGGGSGRVAHDMAYHFAAEHDVALICPGDRTAEHENTAGLRVLEIVSVGEGHLRIPSLSNKNVDRMYDFLDDFAPDIVHAHDPTSLSLIGQVWAKIHSVPFFYTSHVLPSQAIDFGSSDYLKVLSTPLAESLAVPAMLWWRLTNPLRPTFAR
jgi:glycosyltransferase involved in cell wall biosynthesis